MDKPLFIVIASVIITGTSLRGALMKCARCGWSMIVRTDVPTDVDLRLHKCEAS